MTTKRDCFADDILLSGCVQSPRHCPRCWLPVRSPPSRSSDDVIYEMEQVINPAIPNRDFTQKCAASYGLRGWVRNTTCGKVEGEAQGDEETLKKLLQQVNKGPRMAHVVKLEKRELEPRDGEDHFAVMRTAESMFHSRS
ncbi:hypothetical protein NUU61_009867 [Penicillium alfredii]|uniref:acylphosphatase n=1 Tax=Penicillium alfredii TaxID=1506179 RepID=A0A9W9EGX0_9EURO|nr:uncharacterized protein NUU61_009867 [Penicillium alfredii]KAJ5081603.1 hypothetical protein NUU61_009867 [Penicillium alfredii]